jgi:hypothetical protein
MWRFGRANLRAFGPRVIRRYFLVGGTAAALYFGIAWLLTVMAGASDVVAANIAFVAVVIWNYFMHYHWTFESERAHSSRHAGNAGRRRELECLLCHAERYAGAVRLGSISRDRRQSGASTGVMDMMREIVSDILEKVVGSAQRGPIHLTLRLDTNALAIPKTECPPPAYPAP